MVYVAVAARALVFVVFLSAISGKARNREAFASFVDSLRGLPFLPARQRQLAAIATVVAEACIVALVLLPTTAVAGLGLAGVVIASFTAVMVRATRHGAHVTCRCFGVASDAWGRPQLIRNGLLAAAAAIGLVAQRSAAEMGRASGAILVAAVASAAVGGLALARWEDISYLLGRDRTLEFDRR